MSVATTIDFPHADVSALMRQMRRNSELFGKSLGSSVKFAAWSVADALRAATKLSEKRRPVVDAADGRTRGGRKAFDVERYGKTGKTTRRIYARNISEAKRDKRVIIGNRGLAARAWHMAQSKLGSGRGGAKVSPRALGLARRYASVTMRLQGEDPMVQIDNRLNYATDAFKTGGEQTLSNAIERAAKRMAHIIDAKAAKQMGAA